MHNELLLLPISDGEDKSSPLKNRIRKNYQHFRKWAKRTCTDCFRIYDRDIKEYPVAIDYYAGRFCVQYFTFDDDISSLKQTTTTALMSLFDAKLDSIFERSRFRRAKMQQYEKTSDRKDFFTVNELGVKFKVNLSDYLDTGLFLDHRQTRQIVALCSKGKHVLNLFAYTCAFGVHAAMAGASYTKNVDLSNTYTAWGRENFMLNSLPTHNNEIVRADCLKFMDEEILSSQKYDIIIIDPPTISRSKKMDRMFDIQLDYIDLISKALLLLAKDGVLFFSTNSRRFSFDHSLFGGYCIQEISEQTIPMDFHNRKIHKCWKISHVASR